MSDDVAAALAKYEQAARESGIASVWGLEDKLTPARAAAIAAVESAVLDRCACGHWQPAHENGEDARTGEQIVVCSACLKEHDDWNLSSPASHPFLSYREAAERVVAWETAAKRWIDAGWRGEQRSHGISAGDRIASEASRILEGGIDDL